MNIDKEEEKSFLERQIVVFNLANEEFGVDISEVKEIIKLEDIMKIPDTEEYIDGIINLRGKIIVIVSLAKKLNLEAREQNKDTRIIVIEMLGNEIGMIVDSCNEVLRVNGNIAKTPDIITSRIPTNYFEGVAMPGGRTIILLDLTKILIDKEIEHIAKISNNAG
ncbi:MAG: chemotaxis protein CheW [Phycisphaerae bacterium]|jgi:purine-binding chemotaxis protein CheW